jgi:GTP cyclohydrolase I
MNDRQPPHSGDGDGDAEERRTTHAQPTAQGLAARRSSALDRALPRSDFGLDLDQAPERNDEFEGVVRRMLELLGEDPDREGLLRTPQRVANALTWLTRGYETDVKEVVGSAVFDESHENMVMVRDIELYSLCEHHLLPFFGKAHVAYIPNGKIVGLSKIPRLVEVFARRLQVQERLTEQIARAVEDVLEPHGVGVVIEAYHLCMMMRGVEKQNSKTITSALRGTFRDDAKTREEFLYLAHASGGAYR